MYVCTYTSRIQIDSKASASHNLILINFQKKILMCLRKCICTHRIKQNFVCGIKYSLKVKVN